MIDILYKNTASKWLTSCRMETLEASLQGWHWGLQWQETKENSVWLNGQAISMHAWCCMTNSFIPVGSDSQVIIEQAIHTYRPLSSLASKTKSIQVNCGCPSQDHDSISPGSRVDYTRLHWAQAWPIFTPCTSSSCYLGAPIKKIHFDSLDKSKECSENLKTRWRVTLARVTLRNTPYCDGYSERHQMQKGHLQMNTSVVLKFYWAATSWCLISNRQTASRLMVDLQNWTPQFVATLFMKAHASLNLLKSRMLMLCWITCTTHAVIVRSTLARYMVSVEGHATVCTLFFYFKLCGLELQAWLFEHNCVEAKQDNDMTLDMTAW